MSLTERLRVVFVCAFLEFGALAGVPMRPDEIEELMHRMNQPKVAQTLPADDEEGDD